ncbi:MAG: amino acid decarboxylase, partial [Oscillospiraceae bacterium]|nr:amino acid decarboxylase [Oscillospiraceae bacterium]
MRLFGAMRNYAGMGVSRFHMPGHKGVPPLPGIELAYSYDVTEIAGMDSLYEASGPILSLEKAYAGLYGSRECILSAGGSTLCVQGMLAAALLPGDRLLCCRGVHVSAARAMALLDLDPV